jgi:hypothetical protein
MTYASHLAPGTRSFRDHAVTSSPVRRERNLNVGYVLFAFGALWVAAIAAAMAASPRSLSECHVTVLGDSGMCAGAAVAKGTNAARPGLNISGMTIPPGLTGSAYDAF